jgi:hypothetical protein
MAQRCSQEMPAQAAVAVGVPIGGIGECGVEIDEVVAASAQAVDQGRQRIGVQRIRMEQQDLRNLAAEQSLAGLFEELALGVHVVDVFRNQCARFVTLAGVAQQQIGAGVDPLAVIDGDRRDAIAVLCEEAIEPRTHGIVLPSLQIGMAKPARLAPELGHQRSQHAFAVQDRLFVGRDRRIVQAVVVERVVAQLDAGDQPVAQPLHALRRDLAVDLELVFVDEADGVRAFQRRDDAGVARGQIGFAGAIDLLRGQVVDGQGHLPPRHFRPGIRRHQQHHRSHPEPIAHHVHSVVGTQACQLPA